jgi:dTDP-glucose 4,6-dehydratase
MDTTKARAELGWEPAHSLEDGLRLTVEWYLRNSDWLQAIRSQASYQDWVRENYGARGARP